MRHTINLIRTESMLAHAWGRGVTILAILAALGVGVFVGRMGAVRPATGTPNDEPTSNRVTYSHPGPWGELESLPITIECPTELLPVHAFETRVTHWLFKDYTAETLLRLLGDLGIEGDLRDEIRSPEVMHVVEGGVDLTPTPEIVLNLSSSARRSIYSLLASFPENGPSLIFVLAKTVDERFAQAGIPPETVQLFKDLSCEYGRYFVFSDLPSLFTRIPAYDDRVRFLKALTRQPTLLVKLHITPGSDIEALANYWGKACWAKDVRPLLESMSRLPGGARLDIAHLLPPTAASLLYTFPLPANPLNGPPVKQDCHWTAFNFFRDPPDARYANTDFIVQKLKEEHFPVASDPRYGDLVLFLTPDGRLIHSAVYLADGIVYTKNGETSLHPWMFSTVQDLVDQYSFQVPPDKALNVQYFRNKYY